MFISEFDLTRFQQRRALINRQSIVMNVKKISKYKLLYANFVLKFRGGVGQILRN